MGVLKKNKYEFLRKGKIYDRYKKRKSQKDGLIDLFLYNHKKLSIKKYGRKTKDILRD